MRIPDGDLVPRRRRSRYGGGYGRRRRARGFALTSLVVLLLAGAAYRYGLREEEPVVAALRLCPTPTATPSPSPVLPAPAQVRLALLNGTPRNGLAHRVGSQLEGRGFVVTSEGNASAALGGASTVTYGPGALAPATVLARHVHGSRLVSAPRWPAGRVVLVLGGDFRRLATPAEVAARARPSTAPAAVSSTSPDGCRS